MDKAPAGHSLSSTHRGFMGLPMAGEPGESSGEDRALCWTAAVLTNSGLKESHGQVPGSQSPRADAWRGERPVLSKENELFLCTWLGPLCYH